MREINGTGVRDVQGRLDNMEVHRVLSLFSVPRGHPTLEEVEKENENDQLHLENE